MRDDRRGLAAAPQPRKSEVHPDQADGLTVEADIRHHRAARFERGEVNRLAIEDIGFLAHEDRVAVPSHRRRPRSERHRLPRAVVGEQVRGEHLAASAEAAIRLLQADDIGIDLAQYVERAIGAAARSEEHTSELQSLMRISYAVFCLKKKNKKNKM